ncbi:hypothetical protein [Anabaena sp. CCY 9910]|uniref:hypothetical protein n=1 Tax=Anabaena sp. CCY 9910 TaxID=3103870 RepID=UPI0039E165C0
MSLLPARLWFQKRQTFGYSDNLMSVATYGWNVAKVFTGNVADMAWAFDYTFIPFHKIFDTDINPEAFAAS